MTQTLKHAVVTRTTVDLWRKVACFPQGRIGVFFGVQTALFFGDGLDPADFDFYPVPKLAQGVFMLDRGYTAQATFLDLDPAWEIIF